MDLSSSREGYFLGLLAGLGLRQGKMGILKWKVLSAFGHKTVLSLVPRMKGRERVEEKCGGLI
jgi:hypothetical protein